MSYNVKVGQKAIQIKSECGNEGKTCTIIEFLGVHPFYNNAWWYSIIDGPCWLVEYDTVAYNSYDQYHYFGPVPDAWLRPISDIEDNEDVTEEIKELETI